MGGSKDANLPQSDGNSRSGRRPDLTFRTQLGTSMSDDITPQSPRAAGMHQGHVKVVAMGSAVAPLPLPPPAHRLCGQNAPVTKTF